MEGGSTFGDLAHGTQVLRTSMKIINKYIGFNFLLNLDKVSMQTMFACGYALLEMVSVEEKTQIAGVTCVCDASNFGFKHMRNISLEDMKYLALFGQVCKRVNEI